MTLVSGAPNLWHHSRNVIDDFSSIALAMSVNYDHNKFIVMATVTMIIKYNRKTFSRDHRTVWLAFSYLRLAYPWGGGGVRKVI
jgi:hypothetical protein